MKFLNREEVLELVNVSDGTLRYLVREEGFPKGRRISPNRTGYLDADVFEWMQNRPEAEGGGLPNHRGES